MSRFWVQVYGPNIKGGPFGSSDSYSIESPESVVRGADGSLRITTAAYEGSTELGRRPSPPRTVEYMPGQVVRFVIGEVPPR
jgi:hypothetical protein